MLGLLQLVIQLFIFAVIGRALLSWFDPQANNPISQILVTITEPVLGPVRRAIGGSMGGLDLSPMIVILVLQGITILI